MKSFLNISIRTRVETESWKIGEKMLMSLISADARLCPELISKKDEDGSKEFTGFDSVQPAWASPAVVSDGSRSIVFHQNFEWRRKKEIKSEGYVIHTSKNIKSQIVPGSIWFKSEFIQDFDFYNIFKIWCEIFAPQIAMMHLFTKPEISEKNIRIDFMRGLFGAAMKPQAQDMGWAMFYGDEFSNVVDFDLLKNVGASVEKIKNGYLVLVTDKISDVIENFPKFSSHRAKLKSFFPEDFFIVKREPSGFNEFL